MISSAGQVEIGGVDTRYRLWNPPPELLPKVAHNQVLFLGRLAALAPSLRVETVSTLEKADGLNEVEIVVRNIGYLPSNILASAGKLSINEEIVVSVEPGEGLRLESGDAVLPIGNLAGAR